MRTQIPVQYEPCAAGPRPVGRTSESNADPNRLARQLTGRNYVSYSAIATYQRCPLKYYFSYIAGLAPDFVSSSLMFGGAIHSALERHFRRLFEGVPPPSIDDLMAAYQQAGRAEDGAPIRFGKNESEESLADLARRMLAAFQKSEAARPDGELVAVEEECRPTRFRRWRATPASRPRSTTTPR